MKKLVEFLLNSIVQNKERVKITQKSEDNLLTLKINVAPEDIGKVIGKEGRTIKALTQLVRIKAIKEGKGVVLEVQETKNQS